MEQWKTIKDFRDYEVSNTGRIRNAISGNELKLMVKTVKSPFKYCYVNLHKNGRAYGRIVHRLVADAFLPSPMAKRVYVNHIDGNSLNNHIDNLRWQYAPTTHFKEYVSEDYKYCPTCDQVRKRTSFHENASTLDGLCTECKICRRESSRQYKIRKKQTNG